MIKMFNTTILPIQSVWVQWDNRTYRYPLLLQWEFTSWDELWKFSTEQTNSNSAINRVLFKIEMLQNWKVEDDNSKFKIQNSTLTKDRISLLQEIDAIVESFLIKHNLVKEIWQFPVVLVPVSIDGVRESIVLRPIQSDDAMTANFYPMNFDLLKELVREILNKHSDKIENVFYDITNKPPGTIEWE